MKTSSERIEGCQVVLNVEADSEDMESSLDAAYHRLRNRVMVPGFRKGKAPRPILERHVGREALVSEALEKLVTELYNKAIKEEGIDAIGQPQMEMLKRDPPAFKATVPVQVVELGDYRSIKIDPEKIDITDEDEEVKRGLDNLRHSQAWWEPAEREAQMGDSVVFDVEGKVEDETVLNEKGISYKLSEGSSSPAPGFADEIVRMKAGEKKEFTLPFPKDHSNPQVQGKDCLFKVSISEVKEEHLPELDDAFVRGLGQGLETVDQLRESILTRLRDDKEQKAKNKLKDQVIEAAVSLANVEFPSLLTEQEIDSMIQQQLIRLGRIKREDFLRIMNTTEEELRNKFRPTAEKRITNSLVLNKISEEENIEVSDSDIDAEIERRMQGAGENEQIQQSLNSSESRERMRNDLRIRKTIDRLMEVATTESVKPQEESAEDGKGYGDEEELQQ